MPINAIIDHVQNIAQKILPTFDFGKETWYQKSSFQEPFNTGGK